MAGLIRKDDIEAVRNALKIDEIIGEHVALKPAGIGSLKGLCPFHDERTPSFNVSQSMCAHFGVGYSPASWDALTRHLRSKGFTDQEIQIAGLASQGTRGIYDRFRGRLVWPIRDITGATVGFGARR